MPKISTSTLLIIILSIAALLRGFYFTELIENPMPEFMARGVDFDQYNFIELAKEIMAKGWMGESFAGFSPTYGYFLAAIFTVFGVSIYPVLALQLVIGLGCVYLFYLCAKTLFDNEAVGIIAALIACFYGPFIYYEGAVLRASLIAALNLLSFYLILSAQKKQKGWLFVLGGFVVGLSIALRPHLLPVFVFFYLVFLAPGRIKLRLTNTLLFILGLAIAVSPIMVRNAALGQKAVIARPGPTIFWLGNSYDTAGIGLTRTETQQKLAEESGHNAVKTFKILIREVKNHPNDYAALYWRKFKMLLNDYEIPGNMNFYIFKDNIRALQGAFLEFGVVAAFALLGFVVLLRRFKDMSLLYTYCVGLAFFVFMFHIQSRYRLPVVPFFVLFASYGVYFLWETFKTKKYQQACLALVALLGFFLFTKADQKTIDTYLHGRIGYISYSNWAFAYSQKFKSQLTKTGKPDVVLLQKAMNFRNQSIDVSEGKDRDTLILHRVYLHLDAHRYEDALVDLTYLVNKYPNSEQVITTKTNLEYFLQNIPKEKRHVPLL